MIPPRKDSSNLGILPMEKIDESRSASLLEVAFFSLELIVSIPLAYLPSSTARVSLGDLLESLCTPFIEVEDLNIVWPST